MAPNFFVELDEDNLYVQHGGEADQYRSPLSGPRCTTVGYAVFQTFDVTPRSFRQGRQDIFETTPAQSSFEFDRPLTGMDIECNLVDAHYQPAMSNE